MSPWTLAVTLSVVVLAGFAWLLRRMLRPDVPADGVWLEKISVDRYRPMQRLLTGGDCEFLVDQCGYSRSAVRKVRAERRRIFRAYLKNLHRDFNRLHYAARILLLDSPVDRPELAEKLLRIRMVFMWGLLVIQYRLVLHSMGIGEVDVRGLLGSLDGLRIECKSLVPAYSASAA